MATMWLQDSNFPVTSSGRTMHLDIAPNEVANRVLCVGHLSRAARISQLFDRPDLKFTHSSARGFSVYTGTFQNVPISIIGTGMGLPMTDFVIRECRHMVTGKMAFVRYGTCGLIQPETQAGTVVCSDFSRLVRRNPDFDPENPSSSPSYIISQRLPADSNLLSLIKTRLTACFGAENVVAGVDITAEGFYDAQGRISTDFIDGNENLIRDLVELEANAVNFQMETYIMYHLARISKGSVIAAAANIGLINRAMDVTLTEADIREKELVGGHAILKALADLDLST